MGKPGDIPQDVWEAALGTYSENLPASPIALIGFEAIARALMAERERCKRIAHKIGKEQDSAACIEVAIAILEGRAA